MSRPVTWGWFGDPWPGGVCYTDSGRLRAEMRTPTPAGEDCTLCGTPIEAGHRGQAIPHVDAAGNARVGHVHAECLLRSATGSPEHLDGTCACRHRHAAPTSRDYRAEALEVWARLAGTVRVL